MLGKHISDVFGKDMAIVKNVISYEVKPFTFICNKSFSECVFPNQMKTAKIVPVFKTGDKSKFTNLGPVSLLPQFSKILEKLFCERLNNFVERHNILSKNQYGFRKKHSTSLALKDLIDICQYYVLYCLFYILMICVMCQVLSSLSYLQMTPTCLHLILI